MLSPSAAAAPEHPRPSPRCPSCGTFTAETHSKAVDVSTYWRCTRCGEVWNAARREAFAPAPYYRR